MPRNNLFWIFEYSREIIMKIKDTVVAFFAWFLLTCTAVAITDAYVSGQFIEHGVESNDI